MLFELATAPTATDHALPQPAAPSPLGHCDELSVVAMALRLLQVLVKSTQVPPMWICTWGTQTTHRSTQAGLWGLARACRMEQVPACTVDLSQRQAAPGVWQIASGGVLRLASGSVHGLQLRPSTEPEASLRGELLRIPRLVGAHDHGVPPERHDLGENNVLDRAGGARVPRVSLLNRWGRARAGIRADGAHVDV